MPSLYVRNEKKNFFLKDITAYKKLMQQFTDGG